VDNEGTHHEGREDRRPKNLMWPTDKAARVMAKALFARKTELVFTAHGKLGAALGQHMPGLTVFAQARQREHRRKR